MRRLSPRRRETGGVAVIVAVLFAFGAVIGSLAISIDVGNLMSERRQLQNGADSASMAMARLCAKNDASCVPGAVASAAVQGLAAANAKDGATAVTHVCARNVAAFTSASDVCPDGNAEQLTACPPLPAGMSESTPFVEVTTETRDATGSGTKVMTPFARALVGSDGSTVRACARAAWGAAGDTGLTLPLIATECAFDLATDSGSKFAPSPPYAGYPPSGKNAVLPPSVDVNPAAPPVHFPIGIESHDQANPSSEDGMCGKSFNGQTYAGGFSWTATCDDLSPTPPLCVGVPADTCVAAFDATGTILIGSNGAAPANDCKKDGLDPYLGKEVFIPIASGWNDSTKSYNIKGIATFYFAGYNKISAAVGTDSVYKEPSYICPGCTGSSKFVWGWFTSKVMPVGTKLSTGSGLGAINVIPAG